MSEHCGCTEKHTSGRENNPDGSLKVAWSGNVFDDSACLYSEALEAIRRLKVALRDCNHLQHRLAIELDAIPSQPRIELWTREIESAVDEALKKTEKWV